MICPVLKEAGGKDSSSSSSFKAGYQRDFMGKTGFTRRTFLLSGSSFWRAP